MYNPYNNYNSNYYPNYNPNYQQIQNGGLVTIPCEQDARAYPVARGTSVTFRDEKLPYIYTKTLGFSQMEAPIFEKYRLIKEDIQEEVIEKVEVAYVTKDEFDSLREDVAKLRKELGGE